jgi:hypothetical protein
VVTEPKKSDGGHAFPSSRALEKTHTGYFAVEQDRGMTLRDYVAAKALAGRLAMYANPDAYHAFLSECAAEGTTPNEQLAIDAYNTADAMLAERSRR